MTRVDEFARRRALEMYPSLALAVPPVPLSRRRELPPLRCGSYPHAVCNAFWRDHVSNFRLREACNPAAVVGPIRALGSCLAPLYRDGDSLWFDPTIAARCGDLVLFQAPDALLDFDRRSALRPFNFLGKLLVEFADEYFLAYARGMYPLGDIRVLGVAVRPPGISGASFEPQKIDECERAVSSVISFTAAACREATRLSSVSVGPRGNICGAPRPASTIDAEHGATLSLGSEMM